MRIISKQYADLETMIKTPEKLKKIGIKLLEELRPQATDLIVSMDRWNLGLTNPF